MKYEPVKDHAERKRLLTLIERCEKEQTMIEIKPCPVCGQYPQIKRDYGYERAGFGAWCTVQCKPFLRKPHLKVEEGKSTWDRALKYAVESWNEAVERSRR